MGKLGFLDKINIQKIRVTLFWICHCVRVL